MDEKLEVEFYLVWGFLNFIKLFICCLILNNYCLFSLGGVRGETHNPLMA